MSHYDKGAAFYIVTQGGCWLELEGLEARWLKKGDFVALPHCHPHSLRDAQRSPTVSLESLIERFDVSTTRMLRLGGDGPATHLLGGCFWFAEPQQNPLLAALPPLLSVASEQGKAVDWLQTTLAFVEAEASSGQIGAQSVITHLSQILFIQAIRASLDQLPQAGNWLQALRDPEVGQVLALLHQQLEHPWTVERLAAQVAMSRSAFAARFTQCVGEPPLRYLTRWRMNRAAHLLRTSNLKIAAISTRVGYRSETTFSNTFKEWMGLAPGAYRRRSPHKMAQASGFAG